MRQHTRTATSWLTAVFLLSGALGVMACDKKEDQQVDKPVRYELYDVDHDGALTPQEVTAAFRDSYLAEWDLDEDGDLTSKELRKGLFTTWDQNGDDLLSRSEFAPGEWFDSEKKWATYDADGDGFLEADEYYALVEEEDLYAAYDINNDGIVTANELQKGLFEAFDENDNESIEESEFWGT